MTFFPAPFPANRLRRLRQHAWSRQLAQDVHLRPQDLIWPIFVRDPALPPQVATMPGVQRYLPQELPAVAQLAQDLGISALGLFPCLPPQAKTPDGREAWSPSSLILEAIAALNMARDRNKLGLVVDVALDPYTDHGHDGILAPDGTVDNDSTLEALTQQAVVLAQAGVDIVAPSDMMDGRVGAVRQALDKAGHPGVMIMAYAAKYNSAFYGPFREGVGSLGALKGASKLTYQLDPAQSYMAHPEAQLDIAEGADALIVKPGLAYLDVMARLQARGPLPVPLLGYQVSGEYTMIKLGAQYGGMQEEALILETLLAFKRAGCQGIWTYFAPQAAVLLRA